MKVDRIFLPLGILLVFYISLNRVRMPFARRSTLCNALALSADGCALRLEKIPCVSLESLTPCTLYNHACSIGDNPFILPLLTTTNWEMILYYLYSGAGSQVPKSIGGAVYSASFQILAPDGLLFFGVRNLPDIYTGYHS